jgi:formate/nitrite transporter FocA (FNT family)
MLRPREGSTQASTGLDPVLALSIFVLALIALGLFVAAFLAVYTYSTPGVEAPLVIAITLAFSLILVINVVRVGIRSLRRLVAGR